MGQHCGRPQRETKRVVGHNASGGMDRAGRVRRLALPNDSGRKTNEPQLGLFANIEFELPMLVVPRALAPQFKDSEFGYLALKSHGYDLLPAAAR